MSARTPGTPHPALRIPGVAGADTGVDGWASVVQAAGLAVLVADPEGYLARVGEGELDAPLDALPFPAILSLSRYLPQLSQPDGPLRLAVRRALRLAPEEARLAVEVGCSVGPDLRALREVATEVIAFDLYLPALRAARAALDGEAVPEVRRVEGRSFEVDAPRLFPAMDGVTLVVGDALDAPVASGAADIVLALNVLDNVADPILSLSEMDRMLRPGGLLVLGAPFSWQDAITPWDRQLGGAPEAEMGNTPAMLDALLPDFEILTREDVPWVLRDHARAEFHYLVHLVAARKRPAAGAA